MRKKGELMTEQWAQIRENNRLLRQRIGYHRSKLRQERAESARRPKAE